MVGGSKEALEFGYDEDFESDLERISSQDKSRAERVVDLCKEILTNPFKGEPKTHAMDGLYGVHVEELVLLYQLQPNVRPNNSKSDIDEVYFCRIVHHDDQQSAVTNVERAERTTYVSIRLQYDKIPNANKFISKLYETDVFRFKDDSYDSDGVSISGELIDDQGNKNREILNGLLPDEADVEYDEEGFSDFL